MRSRRSATGIQHVRRIGVIADTHGVLHPAVPAVFANVDHIIHAGDVGGAHVLEALRKLAPVTAVDGNNDDSTGEDVVRFRLGALRILLTHILPRPHEPAQRVVESLRREPADFLVFGHSHLPHHEQVDGITYLNPASAGPRRFDFPVSVALIDNGEAVHVALDDRSVDALAKRMNQLSRKR